MFRIIAKWFAKRQYIWRQEIEAATNELNASLSSNLSVEKRDLIGRLNSEADDIDKRIEMFSNMEMLGFWQCESGHEFHIACNCSGNEGVAVIHAHDCLLEGITTENGIPALNEHKSISCPQCAKPAEFIRRDRMTGQEQYESDKERKDAEQVAANKRAQAKAEEENAEGSEKTAKYFRSLAQNNRILADKIRNL